MNHIHSSSTPEETRKFPVTTLLIAIVLLVAAAAILVFNFPVSTVLTYGFLGLLLFGHFFMHGSHGGHNHGTSNAKLNSEHDHSDQEASQISSHNHADGPAGQAVPNSSPKKESDSHQGHSGGC